jgi:hypothetical protein
MSRRTGLKIGRARWHLENTGFHQFVRYWNLNHVFRHTDIALLAVLLLWMLAFDLLQLFIYRCLKRPRRPKDPPTRSGTSSRSCFAKWPPCPSLSLGGPCWTAAEPVLGAAPEWAARKPRLSSQPSPQLSPLGGGRLVPQPITGAQKTKDLVRSATIHTARSGMRRHSFLARSGTPGRRVRRVRRVDRVQPYKYNPTSTTLPFDIS